MWNRIRTFMQRLSGRSCGIIYLDSSVQPGHRMLWGGTREGVAMRPIAGRVIVESVKPYSSSGVDFSIVFFIVEGDVTRGQILSIIRDDADDVANFKYDEVSRRGSYVTIDFEPIETEIFTIYG